MWGRKCGPQASGSREEVAPTRKGCVAQAAWPMEDWAELLEGWLICNTALSQCDGCKWGKQRHTCLTANSKDNATPTYQNTNM